MDAASKAASRAASRACLMQQDAASRAASRAASDAASRACLMQQVHMQQVGHVHLDHHFHLLYMLLSASY